MSEVQTALKAQCWFFCVRLRKTPHQRFSVTACLYRDKIQISHFCYQENVYQGCYKFEQDCLVQLKQHDLSTNRQEKHIGTNEHKAFKYVYIYVKQNRLNTMYEKQQ